VSTAGLVEIDLPPMTAPQVDILQIDEQPESWHDVEGSPRSAKSWGVGFLIWKLAYKYPGIQLFYCRYKDDDLKTLRDVWAKISVFFPTYLHAQWNAKEEAWDFPNGEWVGDVYTGSRVYLSSLRVSEAMTADAVHGKYKGKTLAVVIVEEAQEVPWVNIRGLKERLSQSRTPLGKPFRYPLKLILVHNCIDEDHPIAEEFPLDATGTCTKADHRHHRADLYSNAVNLGPDVMMGYERDYPPGHVLRRTVIEGRRGVTMVGKPVYAGYFDREVHVDRRLRYSSYYPLLEGWDFGHLKPAVVWFQYLGHIGAIRILGAVKGKELFLESFAPRVIEIRRRWFPEAIDVWSWCDPSGATGNQGRKETAVRLLHDLEVPARYDPNANDASVRDGAIQVLGGHMERAARDGSPAFLVHPRTIEVAKSGKRASELSEGEDPLVETETELLAAALEVGYVWDEHAPSDANPNVRKPRKGTRFDDLMNALEYPIIGEAIRKPSSQEMWSADRRVAKAAQRIASAAVAAVQRPRATGPTGETLAEAERRLALHARQARDVDPADVRRHPVGRRGGW
jgi:hypothetical protein